jgi:hypothetical protein
MLKLEVGEAFYVRNVQLLICIVLSPLELCLLETEREREKGRLRTGSTSTHTLDRN